MGRFDKQVRIDYLNTNAGRLRSNPKLSATKIATEIANERKIQVNPETIRRIIR